MTELVKKCLTQWREESAYLFFGVLTTLINYVVFGVLHVFWGDEGALAANLIAFVVAVAFAYLTNKIFVFESRSWRPALLIREAASFVAARLFSFGLEEAGLYVAVHVLVLGQYALFGVDGVMLAKFALSVLSTILNYFFSKFFIFARKGKSGS